MEFLEVNPKRNSWKKIALQMDERGGASHPATDRLQHNRAMNGKRESLLFLG
jgi:hypothetical protein